MARRIKIIICYILLILDNGFSGKIPHNNEANTDYIQEDNEYSTENITNESYLDNKNNDNEISVDENMKSIKKCEVAINGTLADESVYPKTNILHSIYLNNIYSSVTTNLIEAKVSVDDIELNGVNLFDIVNSECGGTKKCPDLSRNWTTENSITIGFLGAYGWSQVS